MSTSFANKRTIIHEGDGLQFIAMAPDVCKTPSPGGPVPIPYPNMAMSSDLADGSKTVKIEGNSAALAESNLKTSTGDEGGTAGGGVASSKIKGKAGWVVYSTDVKFEGQGVVRFLDDCLHNGNAYNSNSKNRGKRVYPGPAGDIKCDNCGKDIGDPSHFHFDTSKEAKQAAEDAKPRGQTTDRQRPMKSAMVSDKGTFTGVAGDSGHPLKPENFSKSVLSKNLKTGKTIPADGPKDGNDAGNCAEQKALYNAITTQGAAFDPIEFDMSVVRVNKEWKKGKPVYVEQKSCTTCKRVITSLLCTNEASKP
jgi:Domain of unknown function (DUF4150)